MTEPVDLTGIAPGDEIDVTIRVTVTRVLPDREVGGLEAKGKAVKVLLPMRILRKVEKVHHD